MAHWVCNKTVKKEQAGATPCGCIRGGQVAKKKPGPEGPVISQVVRPWAVEGIEGRVAAFKAVRHSRPQ
jgi:hypothetical protein